MEQSSAVTAAIEEAMALDAAILEASREILHETALLPDLFVAAVLNRALQLLHGFEALVRTRNYLSATPLFRLQLDNAIRLWAGALAPSFDDFTNAVIRGDQIKKMMSRDGMPMTDKNLVKSLAENFGLPMLVASYEYACGFVHLSGEHVFATNRTDDGRIIGRIVREDVDTPEAKWLDLITGFSSATTLVLDVAGGWARRKTESRENV
jgi:hypothetical protein